MYEELLRIRQGFEKIARDHSGILNFFPKGCCGYSCNLLATYLEEKELGKFNYIEAREMKSFNSHAWLLSEKGEIIDITADQFGLEAVIYTKESHPLSVVFSIQKNMGKANIFYGSRLDNSYYSDYEKLIKVMNNY